MANYLGPDPLQSTFFIPGSNTPGNGVQVFMYAAGTTTPQTAYQGPTTSTPWAHPIVLDSGGNIPSGSKQIWLVGGQSYKAIYAPANDTSPPVSPYLTLDNLSGVNDPSGISASSEWVTGTTPTFISATSFSLVGDQTTTYTVGRRVKAVVTAGTVYATIVGSSFSAITTITLRMDSTSLDSGLNTVSYGLLDAANPSVPSTRVEQPTQTVTASSTTLNLVSTAARHIIVSSNSPVSTMPLGDGQIRFVTFSSAITLFTTATFVLPTGANISTVAGDSALVAGESALTRILMYQRASGVPLANNISTLSSSIAADVNLTSTAIFFDGPTVAQGTSGVWFASGYVTFLDGSGSATFLVKLWDGTTVIASTQQTSVSAGNPSIVSLSGTISSPVGNLRISVRDSSSTTGIMKFNSTGNSKDSTITVLRIG